MSNIPIRSGSFDSGLSSPSTEEERDEALLEIRNENIRCSGLDYGERPNGFTKVRPGRYTKSSIEIFGLKDINERIKNVG